MTEYPVIIAGGSLAGMAAALRLQQHGMTPLVIEKSQFPRKKLCGEFLGPDSFKPLEILGLWEQVYKNAYGPIEQVIFHPDKPQTGKPLIISMKWLNSEKPYGLGITRSVLDNILMVHAKAQGIPILERHKIVAPLQGNHNFEIYTQSPEETPQHFQAPIFIDASGRHGGLFLSDPKTVLSQQKPNKHGLKHVGFKVNVRLVRPSADKTLQMFFFPGGYGGIQPLSPEVHNICFLTSDIANADSKHNFSQFIAQTIGRNAAAQAILENAVAMEPIQTTANLNLTLNRSKRSPFIRVGTQW